MEISKTELLQRFTAYAEIVLRLMIKAQAFPVLPKN